MRKPVGVVLAVLVILGMLAPPGYAQAPAPKVTINGLVDFVGTAYGNLSQASCTAQPAGSRTGVSGCDVTDSRDHGSYTRERGVFTLTGEVGRSKGVWAVELDFTNGAGLNNAGNTFGGGANSLVSTGTTANLDLDTDVAGAVETKWLYVETPITGNGSLMPFIPVSTIGRFGAQPFRGHDYKPGILATGDFPGVSLETSWAPNVRSTLTFVQIGEGLDTVQVNGQKESWALITSVEIDIFKGLTIKPTFAYASYDGGNCGSFNLGTEGKDNFSTLSCGSSPSTQNGTTVQTPNAPAGATAANGNGSGSGGAPTAIGPGPGGSLRTTRYYIGVDAKWETGPFSVQPTFIYEFGKQDLCNQPAAAGTGSCAPGGPSDTNINTFIFDTIGGFRTGPLNLQARVMYTPGMHEAQKVRNGADIGYYQAINPGFSYMAGWTEIWTGGVDYLPSLFGGVAPGATLRQSPSYDKYGRIFAGVAADYAFTPALTVTGLFNGSWSDTEVPLRSAFTAGGIVCETAACRTGDTAHFLGMETAAGFTYRFAPNVAFDLIGAYLVAGDALSHARSDGGQARTAEDVWKVSSRVRITF